MDDWLESVRQRPGMYIGTTGPRGLAQLLFEVVNSAVDEALAGANDRIDVTIRPDGSVTMRDRGRGIPVDSIPARGLPAVTVALTEPPRELRAPDWLGVAGGLNGLNGVAIVNVLSEWLVVEVERDGRRHRQPFARGVAQAPLADVGPSAETGTTISFLPDAEIFASLEWPMGLVRDSLRAPAFLVPGLTISLDDGRRTEEWGGGIVDFVRLLEPDGDETHPTVFACELEDPEARGSLAAAVRWGSSYAARVGSFANTTDTRRDPGRHVAAFVGGLVRAIEEQRREHGRPADEPPLERPDVREGMTAVVSVMARDPAITGQYRTRLTAPWIEELARRAGRELFGSYLRDHPADRVWILDRVLDTATARRDAQARRAGPEPEGGHERRTVAEWHARTGYMNVKQTSGWRKVEGPDGPRRDPLAVVEVDAWCHPLTGVLVEAEPVPGVPRTKWPRETFYDLSGELVRRDDDRVGWG